MQGWKEQIRQQVLREMFAEWVSTMTEQGHDKRTLSYEVFLTVNDLLLTPEEDYGLGVLMEAALNGPGPGEHDA
jgi:hypothetical protein